MTNPLARFVTKSATDGIALPGGDQLLALAKEEGIPHADGYHVVAQLSESGSRTELTFLPPDAAVTAEFKAELASRSAAQQQRKDATAMATQDTTTEDAPTTPAEAIQEAIDALKPFADELPGDLLQAMSSLATDLTKSEGDPRARLAKALAAFPSSNEVAAIVQKAEGTHEQMRKSLEDVRRFSAARRDLEDQYLAAVSQAGAAAYGRDRRQAGF